MRSPTDYSDRRNKTWCIHCSRVLVAVETNRDHVPTRGLLQAPLPANAPTIPVCLDCNKSFASDEEYTIAFLGCVLSGSTEPSEQQMDSIAAILQGNDRLRRSLELARREYKTIGGETRIVWEPESNRIERVIVKNARGHVFFELGEPVFDAPSSVWFKPFEIMTATERAYFEEAADQAFWPEVGSRLLTRVVEGQDLEDGWIVVQPGVYRYAVTQGPIRVRLTIYDYLAAEVCWDE
jgi:hypothetical protein